MDKQTPMTPEQSFFAVFCIEALADELGTTGDKIYKMLAYDSDILDGYLAEELQMEAGFMRIKHV